MDNYSTGKEPFRVRSLRVVQKLLKRDMEFLGLGLREGAREGMIAVGTLAFVLDEERVFVPHKQPKRGFRTGTLLQLRSICWTRNRTKCVLDYLLAKKANPKKS